MVSKTLRSVVADANVPLSASLGHAARRVFEKARVFHVITTDVAAGEVREFLPVLAAKAGLDRAPIIRVFDALPVWSNDDDFDDAGVLVFTTAELLRVLGFSSVRPR